MIEPIDPQDAPPGEEPQGFSTPPRSVVGAMAQTLDFPERAVVELLATVHEAAVTSLSRAQEFQAQGFGRWVVRQWRPRGPSVLNTCYGWDPIETPHPGPVDFEPSASLLRQLDDRELNTRAMFNCTPLLQTLMQRTGVPQAQAARVMRLLFVTLTDLLLVEGFATVPGFGNLLSVRRPTRLIVDPGTGGARPQIRRWLQFRASPELMAALPSTHRTLAWDARREPEVDYAQLLAEDPEGAPPAKGAL